MVYVLYFRLISEVGSFWRKKILRLINGRVSSARPGTEAAADIVNSVHGRRPTETVSYE